MAIMHDSNRQSDLITVEGTFDAVAASALHQRIVGSRRLRRVVLDFSRARDVSDLGIAVLAHGLVDDRVAVRLRGLSMHHERMLRYLGLDATLLERSGAPG